jgi:2-polyprenyl-6-methoxyphenol hydroxylase-like FAD-dependent oxidoreductase
MRIICVGGGPAGLYFAISAKRRDPGQHITVIERDPPEATYGWGVVYWDNLLDMMFRNDVESARRIRCASRLWQEQEIRVDGASAYLPGYGYSIQRSALLDILTRRARELDVVVRDGQRFDPASPLDRAELAEADLVVASDGAHSAIRAAHHDSFGARTALGDNRYIWLGTPTVFSKFTFSFRRTAHGCLWFHAYPSSADISTCIVECTTQTWHAHGFDRLDPADGLALLCSIFDADLGGAGLISQPRSEPARWLRFAEITNDRWVHDNIALLGDAAHTTHFTIGSGTRLAMIDAVSLAQCLYEEPVVALALREYQARRQPALRTTQASARASQAWFEHIDHYLDQDPALFAYSMSCRQGEQPPWRYRKHLATQLGLVRAGRRRYDTLERWYAAARRGETMTADTTATPAGQHTAPVEVPVSVPPSAPIRAEPTCGVSGRSR